MTILAIGLTVFGLFFLVVGSIGMLRLPNVFVRAHALSLTDSMGAILVLAGLAVYHDRISSHELDIVAVLAVVAVDITDMDLKTRIVEMLLDFLS